MEVFMFKYIYNWLGSEGYFFLFYFTFYILFTVKSVNYFDISVEVNKKIKNTNKVTEDMIRDIIY